MIALIDFGAGNLKSAYHAFQSLGSKVEVVEKPSSLSSQVKALVLPGDGSFRKAYQRLKETGFAEHLQKENKLPLLGICVGFQLLFESSEEDGGSEGLGFFRGKVVRFPAGALKVPHMGWNIAMRLRPSALLQGLPEQNYFYFVHSYYPSGVRSEDVLLESDYGRPFPAAVAKGSVSGFQFHPEKSHLAGRQILKNFCAEYV